MTAFGPVYITFFALLLPNLSLVSGTPLWVDAPPTNQNQGVGPGVDTNSQASTSQSNLTIVGKNGAKSPWEKGHGPQISTRPYKPQANPKNVVWDKIASLDNNVLVVDKNTGIITRILKNNPHTPHAFDVTDSDGHTLFGAHEKHTARCAFSFTYQTDYNVTIDVHPRGYRADRWIEKFYGNHTYTGLELKYQRDTSGNYGNIFFANGTRAAVIYAPQAVEKSNWDPETLSQVKEVQEFMWLETEDNVRIGAEYFLSLWMMSKKRMDRCGEH